MSVSSIGTWPRVALLGCAMLAAVSTGCQSTIGGQTLPSAYYLEDDVQYFPAGPEFKLTRQVEELEKYKLRRAGIEAGIAE